MDILSLKSYLIGPSHVGKTTTLHRLTGEINHLSPDEIIPSSTGIDKPLTVQLYAHHIEQSDEQDEPCKYKGFTTFTLNTTDNLKLHGTVLRHSFC